MKRYLRIIFSALLVASLFHECTLAHQGTIYINGVISKKACSISPDSQNMTVTMDSVQSTFFTKAGMGADYQPFTINVENCAGTEGTIGVTFNGTPDKDNPNLLALLGGEGYATGIAIGIYNQDKTMIPMANKSKETLIMPGQNEAALHFYARYVATGDTVTTGTANATSTFILYYA